MELEKLSCDATGRRVYGEWDDMKKRGRRAARSGAEEVVGRNQRVEETVAANDWREIALIDQRRSFRHARWHRKTTQLLGDLLLDGLVNRVLPLDLDDAYGTSERTSRTDRFTSQSSPNTWLKIASKSLNSVPSR